ncbi:unnamed protein product [Heligmosomoides polygyrus]|uniref:Reverse transcriptase domain-containing protein n=1 Tax=Heligmosomoides polygyrus TaxID=6339 RepID=A0A183G5I5_HELPZ|nr:unnamed protein product [Heligmosomoides polygyrus]
MIYISLSYKDVEVIVKIGVPQVDTIYPMLFSANVENVMADLEWEDMGVVVDGRQLQPSLRRRHRVHNTEHQPGAANPGRFRSCACGNVGLQLNLTKTMFMRNGQVSDASFSIIGTNIS